MEYIFLLFAFIGFVVSIYLIWIICSIAKQGRSSFEMRRKNAEKELELLKATYE